MVSLRCFTLGTVVLLLSPQATEGLFFRAIFCLLFRRACEAPKPPVKPPIKPPIKPPVPPPSPTVALPPAIVTIEDNKDKNCYFVDGNILTICILVSNRQLSTVPTDHAVTLGRVAPTISVPAANRLCVTVDEKNLIDGPNQFKIVAKDVTGNTFTYNERIWAAYQGTRFTVNFGNVVQSDTLLFVTMADDPEVQDFTSLSSESFSTPLNRVMFVSAYKKSNGYSRALPVFLNEYIGEKDVVLYTPAGASNVINDDLSMGTVAGWLKSPSSAEMAIVSHVENLIPRRSLRELQGTTDKNIYICTSPANPSVLMYRAVAPPAGATKADVRFRFSTNDVKDRHGYHIWLLAKDANNQGYEYFITSSGSGLMRSGDPFNLIDFDLISSKWMVHSLPLRPGTTYVELQVTVFSQPDSSQPNLRSCVNVDYLSVA